MERVAALGTATTGMERSAGAAGRSADVGAHVLQALQYYTSASLPQVHHRIATRVSRAGPAGDRDGAHTSGMSPAIAPDAARRLLDDRRATVRARLARIEERLRGIREVRGEWTDEEHDPEGFATVFEWSQAEGARAEHAAELAELDRAEVRIADGSYGVCAVCREPIPEGQLERRPARTTCVACTDAR